ncbi:nuclear transport factor 2 family protein [Yinghuangia sp. ASG 101]|uniref:nuclear transport factor 2 family protein n=1 Tax=Yinghuangia sp. ASG 101 TaxID=2896848 RepID=UPI001E2DD132|nr:nuclear transport factor 2 family protein [Yinghuangia sp. ASG 101]UGQ11784.1 nuclear transport factor 2 family protein [Yinghuangia sp. ASG 101]
MSQTASAGPSPVVSADLHLEVRYFYVRQMRLLDEGHSEEFAETFSDDGVFHHTSATGAPPRGRAEIAAAAKAALGLRPGLVPRHWFDMMLVEPRADGSLYVTYQAVVSRTDATGAVDFEPTVFVEDELVREDGRLLNRSRTIHRDDLRLSGGR